MNHCDIIIIGSGLGGLLCGYILAKEGKNVCILERNPRPGGCLQTFRRNGVEFDTGVHYLGGLDKGQVLERYFRYFGLMDRVDFERLNENGFDIIAFDDTEFPIAMGFENFREQLLLHFPSSATALLRYTEGLEKISKAFPLYNLEVPADHREDIYRERSAFTFFSSFDAASPNGYDLSKVLAGNSFLYAGDPATTPLHVAALINHSFISSAWRPVGGSMQIAEHLVREIQKMGGTVLTNRNVTTIHPGNDRFTLNTGSNELFISDLLIADTHPAAALKMINPGLVRKSYRDRIIGLEKTTSSFALYIVTKENSFPQLDHNVYFHKKKRDILSSGGSEWPDHYMLQTPAYSGVSSSAKSIVVMTTMNFREVEKWSDTITGQRGSDYEEFKKEKAEKLLDLVAQKFSGIHSCIDSTEISTPLTWRDYTGTPEGSMYGIQRDWHDPLRTTVLPKTKIPGLFFTGQNTNLHGVLGVTIGSVLTCSEIIGIEYLLKKIRNAG
ncbi:MAG: FAD-dependent oxidoreductase [Bacteroidetes bacterium]|nr:FAD-dependent oxidoreductase [Bacteroidota bacterium]